MAKPPELPPNPDRGLSLVETGYILNGSKFTIEPYDDEALTAALAVSWTPGRVVPTVSDFTVRRQQRLEKSV